LSLHLDTIKSDVSPSTVRGQTLARNSNLSRRFDVASEYRKSEMSDRVDFLTFDRKKIEEERDRKNVDIKIQCI